MRKRLILFSFSKEGTFPVCLFIPKKKKIEFRFEALDIETGINPVNWFRSMEKNSIFGRVMPMFDGRRPWIWLPPMSNCVNEERLKIEGGIVPDNLFALTPKNGSLVNWLKE